jgi:pyruvate dehydrogenase complex dehydrogenase (E1) component
MEAAEEAMAIYRALIKRYLKDRKLFKKSQENRVDG